MKSGMVVDVAVGVDADVDVGEYLCISVGKCA